MRFRTRTFLLCFIPFALLFAASSWMAQKLVQSTVRDGLLASLRDNQLALARAQAKVDQQNNRFLKIEGESPELKAAMQLLLDGSAGAGPDDSQAGDDARKAIMEDQLRALGEQMDLDLLFVSAPDGTTLAGVARGPATGQGAKGALAPLSGPLVAQPTRGLLVLGDRIFEFASAPIANDAANVGTLSVGEYFDLHQPGKPAVLVHDGEVVDANLGNAPDGQVQAAMKGCAGRQACSFRLGGTNWIAIPMQDLGGGYKLWSLENVDEATGPIRMRLRNFFLAMAFGSVLVALLCSAVCSRSIEKPVAQVIARLRHAEQTGELPEAPLALSSTTEMRELTESFTRAAVAARHAREKLSMGYVEFVGSLANALDARDRYTAGHSMRVSQYSCATAEALGLGADLVQQIRMGAQLHDIGKIGIPDNVLQKPGRLTAEEFAKVKEHPVIGRWILEGVEGLAPYLDAVELHHENWNGTGYPKGQRGEETPIEARIVHVSDAYDAMTSDRSYRASMTHEQAMEELKRCAGEQFDPQIVDVFVKLPRTVFLAVDAQPERELQAAEAD